MFHTPRQYKKHIAKKHTQINKNDNNLLKIQSHRNITGIDFFGDTLEVFPIQEWEAQKTSEPLQLRNLIPKKLEVKKQQCPEKTLGIQSPCLI